MATAHERPEVAESDDDSEPVRAVEYRTERPAYTLELPVTIRVARTPDGRGFTAELPDRTVTSPSLWDLFGALFCEFEDAHDNRAADAALADADENGTVPWEQVKAELGL